MQIFFLIMALLQIAVEVALAYVMPTKETVLDTIFYVILLISLSDVVKTGVLPWPICSRKMSQCVVQCYCWSAIPETSYDIWPPPHHPQLTYGTAVGDKFRKLQWAEDTLTSSVGAEQGGTKSDERHKTKDEFLEVVLMFCAKL